jgi:hypothetical protein
MGLLARQAKNMTKNPNYRISFEFFTIRIRNYHNQSRQELPYKFSI